MTIPRLPTLAALAAAAVATTAPNLASADEVHVRARGKVEVRASGHIRIGGGARRTRVYRHPRPTQVYVGVRYAEPPPPPPVHTCYDTCSHAPPVTPFVYGEPVAPPAPPLPKVGIGVFGGSVAIASELDQQMQDPQHGADAGLFGRFRLTDHFLLEGEISSAETTDGSRRDSRLGLGVVYDFSPRSRLSPYAVLAAGGGVSERYGGQVVTNQAYGELGLGLEWRITHNISLLADLRGGGIHHTLGDRYDDVDPVGDDAVYLQPVAPTTPQVEDEERLARFRLGAAYFF